MASQIDPRLYSAAQQHPYEQQPQHQHQDAARLPPLQHPYQAPPGSAQHHHQPSPYYSQQPLHQVTPAGPVDPSLTRQQDSPTAGREQYGGEYASPEDDNEGPPGSVDHKRSRACEACRGLKVKCDMDDPDKPCKRCAKAKRQCIVTAPSRRRQKKQDNRVAELERKIDALTASLQAKESPATADGHENRYGQYSPLEAKIRGLEGGRTAVLEHDGSDKDWREHVERYQMQQQSAANMQPQVPDAVAGHKRRHSDDTKGYEASTHQRASSLTQRDLANVIWDQASIDSHIDSLISRKNAAERFQHYVSDMAPCFPAVIFKEGATASEVRASKPTLFLAIVAAAAFGFDETNVVQRLDQLLLKVFADSIVRNGEKNLDLIQALVVTTLWYRAPDRFEALNFYQLAHMAAVMAVELGMGKRLSAAQRQAMRNTQSQMPKGAVDIESLEARRAFLGCYFLCSQISMNTRKPMLLRWNSYLDECVSKLEESTNPLQSDAVLTHTVKLQHLNEDVGVRFLMDDPAATLAVSDPTVPQALHDFEDRLRNLKSSLPTEARRPFLTYNEHCGDLYMHEIAMHIDHNIDDWRAPITVESLKAASGQTRVLSPAHSTAIRKCVEAVQAMVNTFVEFDLRIIRGLPIFYLIRVAYAVVALNKLYTAVTKPGSDVGKMISLEQLKAEELMDKLVHTFDVAVKENAFRPARMFFVVVKRLHDHFKSNKDNKDGPPSDASQFNPYAADAQANEVLGDPRGLTAKPGERRTSGETQHGKRGPTDPPETKKQRLSHGEMNPLETLSDAATMTSNRDAASDKFNSNQAAYQGNSQQNWYASQPAGLPQQPYTAQQANMSAADPSTSSGAAAGYPDDFYNMSYGFEHAMGMALGGSNAQQQGWLPVDPMFDQSTNYYDRQQ